MNGYTKGLAVALASLLAAPVAAQHMHHSMAGMPAPASPSSAAVASPMGMGHAVSRPPPSPGSPHGHQHATMSAPAMQHAGHDMPMPPPAKQLPPNDHVAPAAPQRELAPMSPAHMAEMMQMHDKAVRGMWLLDRLERRRSTRGAGSTAWNVQGWWGGDLNRLDWSTEGERSREGTRNGRVELHWSHAASAFRDWQWGVRHDFGWGPARQWFAAGVKGLTPYWFELAATLYAGPRGRTAARVEVGYELLFTQRLILSPSLELNLYGKDDARRDIRSGLSDVEAGLRLRYEFSRRFAPYLGVDWSRHFGRFDDGRRHEPAHETAWVAGVRFWF